MPIVVTCRCGAKLRARDADAGKRTRCPKCRSPLTVPEAEEVELTLNEEPTSDFEFVDEDEAGAKAERPRRERPRRRGRPRRSGGRSRGSSGLGKLGGGLLMIVGLVVIVGVVAFSTSAIKDPRKFGAMVSIGTVLGPVLIYLGSDMWAND